MKLHVLCLALFCITITNVTHAADHDPKKEVNTNSLVPVVPHVLDIADKSGLTPLHTIIWNQNYDDEQKIKWIEKFVRHGADINKSIPVNADNNPGFSPLHFAVACKASPIVIDALLKYGANMRAVDAQQRTPIALAVTSVCEEQLESLLFHIPDTVQQLIPQGLPSPEKQ